MWNWLEKSAEINRSGKPFVLVSVIRSGGSTPRGTDAKMLVLPNGSFFGTIGGGHLEAKAIQDALEFLKSGESQTVSYPLGAKVGQCCGGVMDLFFEVFNTGPSLYIFGGGHVGQAVCKTLSGTPFRVHLVDERSEWINHPELPSNIIRHESDWSDVIESISWSEKNTYCVVMTYRHDLDQEILEKLVRKPTRYLGLIGSQAKWKRFQQRMLLKKFTPAELSQVHCPIGLPIGGKTPQEIAISFSAEIIKIYNDSHAQVSAEIEQESFETSEGEVYVS